MLKKLMDKIIAAVLDAEKISNKEYYVAVLDGNKCKTTPSFLKAIGRAFHFPSYYGQNVNALRECLSDLEWLDEPNYILFVTNATALMSKESTDERDRILTLLEDVFKEWASVPNFEGEELHRRKADFKVRYL